MSAPSAFACLIPAIDSPYPHSLTLPDHHPRFVSRRPLSRPQPSHSPPIARHILLHKKTRPCKSNRPSTLNAHSAHTQASISYVIHFSLRNPRPRSALNSILLKAHRRHIPLTSTRRSTHRHTSSLSSSSLSSQTLRTTTTHYTLLNNPHQPSPFFEAH